jgi:hypothetical protein
VTAPVPPARSGVLRLVVFFLVLGAAIFAVQALVSAGLRRITTSGFGVSNEIINGRVNAEIVISGSSRAVVHYDPQIIQQHTGLKAYNIGRDGSQTDMQLAVLKTYLRHNAKPRLVIHNLDMFAFLTTHEIYDPGQYLPYLNEPDIYAAVRQINPDAWKWKYLPLYGYSVEDMRFTWLRGLGGLLGINPKQDYIQGYRPAYVPWRNDFERFKAQNANGVRFEIEPQGVRDLDELVAVCRRQNIPVLLVYSPVYYEMQALEKNRNEVFSEFQTLSERWQAPVWDYSGSPICRRQDLFYNSQHLNHEGATAFSTELATRLSAEHPWK